MHIFTDLKNQDAYIVKGNADRLMIIEYSFFFVLQFRLL